MRNLFISLALLIATSCGAQSLTPVIQVAGHHKANISFDVANNMLTPAVLTLEPVSMTPGPNGPTYRTLDSDAHVEVSELSAKLGAKQHHTFRAKISCASDCVVAIWVTFMPPKQENGAQVAIHFPETAYICESAKNCRENTLKANGAL